VLQRGEKLDNLVERSTALSAQSKMFYKTAKKVHLFLFLYLRWPTSHFYSKTLAVPLCEALDRKYALYLTFHMYKYPVDNLQIFD
jgi:Synaptobrevin